MDREADEQLYLTIHTAVTVATAIVPSAVVEVVHLGAGHVSETGAELTTARS